MKIGKEVEGRHIGLKTIFCSAEEIEHKAANVVKHAEAWGVHQIYISDLENILDITDMNVTLGTLALNYIVTVERTKVPPMYLSDSIDIMLNVQNEEIWKMRRRDQVKFSQDLKVAAVALENMTITLPEDFAGDVELDD